MKNQIIVCLAVISMAISAWSTNVWSTNSTHSQTGQITTNSNPSFVEMMKGDSSWSMSKSNTLWASNIPEVFVRRTGIVDDNSIPLPLQDKMDFDSDIHYQPTKWGSDVFFWRLVPLGKELSLGPFITSEYPLSPIGPYFGQNTAGIGIRIKSFKFW